MNNLSGLQFSFLDDQSIIDYKSRQHNQNNLYTSTPVTPQKLLINPNKKRNIEIEKRINKRMKDHSPYGNPYGGMGMDCNTKEELKQKYEEVKYMAYLKS